MTEPKSSSSLYLNSPGSNFHGAYGGPLFQLENAGRGHVGDFRPVVRVWTDGHRRGYCRDNGPPTGEKVAVSGTQGHLWVRQAVVDLCTHYVESVQTYTRLAQSTEDSPIFDRQLETQTLDAILWREECMAIHRSSNKPCYSREESNVRHSTSACIATFKGVSNHG